MSNPCDERPEIPIVIEENNNPPNIAPPALPPNIPLPAPVQIFPRTSIREGDISAGRNSIIVHQELYGPPASAIGSSRFGAWDAGDFISSRSNFLTSENIDNFRACSLSVWNFDGANFSFLNYNSQTFREAYKIPFKINISNVESYTNFESITNLEISLDKQIIQQSVQNFNALYGDGTRFLDIYINGENSAIYDSSKHSELKLGLINTEKIFLDSVFKSQLPFYKKEVDSMAIPVYNYAEIKLNTHQFIQDSVGLSETQLPNIYRRYAELEQNQELENILQGRNNFEYGDDILQKYTSKNVEQFESINSQMENDFSNFVEITINTDQNNLIAEFISRNGMDRHLLDFISNEENKDQDRLYTQVSDETILGRDEEDPTGNDRIELGLNFNSYSNFMNRIEQLQSQGFQSDILQYPLKYDNYDNPLISQFDDAIKSQIFLRQLKQYIQDNSYNRTFQDILDGKKAHSEIVAYKIVKKDEQNNVIQTFYLCDSNSVLSIDFRDTQIIAGKKYTYEIFAVNMVIATNISYNKLEAGEVITDSSGNEISFTNSGLDPNSLPLTSNINPQSNPVDLSVFTTSLSNQSSEVNVSEEETVSLAISTGLNLMIYETPFFRKELQVYDSPPMFPHVSFLPYLGIDNKLSILFQSNTGQTQEVPRKILDSDTSLIRMMRLNQEKLPNKPIAYRSDSIPEFYEMFVLNYRPSSYEEFKEAQYVKVPAPGKAGIVTFEVEPNKDFYYIFRTVDNGGVSNPTEVYRARIVSYQNGIYLDMEVIELLPPQIDNIITFERFLSIEPTTRQRSINFLQADVNSSQFKQSAPLMQEFSVGNVDDDDELIWGKQYKIRIKSITTGKIIDLNINFDKKIEEIKPRGPSLRIPDAPARENQPTISVSPPTLQSSTPRQPQRASSTTRIIQTPANPNRGGY